MSPWLLNNPGRLASPALHTLQPGEILDPHTATGYRAAERARVDTSTPMITLATAHPAKFAEAVVKAGFQGVPLPTHMDDLLEREERYTVLPAELSAVQQFVADNRR